VSTPTLGSHTWFGKKDLDGFAHRSWIKAEGFSDLMFDGRPVIGIANSWSELTNCNAHLRQVAEAAKRGVLSAGGFPLEFPTISLGEILMKPTTMLFRNLMAMDVEECIRAYPLDGVVDTHWFSPFSLVLSRAMRAADQTDKLSRRTAPRGR
jgi:dihydroxyacid dehydratase/phosphogluconate dehydratase